MSEPRLRALVLAAGLGTRLRPLTRNLPKPLLPVLGKPVVAYTLAALEELGCEAAAVNLYHLGEKVAGRFGSRHGAMEIVYSREPELLGTLGALALLAEFFAPAELVVVVNGDSLCRWPLAELVRRHRASGARATLLVSTTAPVHEFGGGVALGEEKSIVGFGRGAEYGVVKQRRVFAGAHVFEPSLVADLERRPQDFVTDLYTPLLAAGEPIAALETRRRWHDLGTPERYLRAVLAWSRDGRGVGRGRRGWVSPAATVDPTATVKGSVIEAGVSVGAESRLDRSLVLPGARVGAGCRVRRSIVGFGARLPSGTRVEGRLVSAARADLAPEPGDSVLGGLVYRPLER